LPWDTDDATGEAVGLGAELMAIADSTAKR
jgi:hypothetical protein